jgi:hypothetical protein
VIVQRSLRHFLATAIVLGGGAAQAKSLGVMVDAGLPDGAVASLVYRPWSFLRLTAGGGTNLVAPGVRGGLSLIWGSLAATAQAGHNFAGDANGLARSLTGNSAIDVPALREVGYDYVNLSLGLEFGPSWLTFFVHGGMSRVTGTVKQLGPTITEAAKDDGTTVTFGSDPNVKIWTVSARAGLIVYFAL